MPPFKPAVVLVVASAIHGEIRVPVAGSLTVGRAISSDLVLGDPSVADTHFTLEGAAPVRLHGVGQPIVFADGERIEAGQDRTITHSCSFRAGDVSMRLEMDAAPPRASRILFRSKQAFAAVVLGVAIIGSTAFATAEHQASPKLSPVPLLAVSPQRVDAVAIHRLIKDELSRHNLDGIQLDTLPEGSLRASGSIASHQLSAWQAVKRWADDASAGTALLIDNVSVEARPPALAIQAAWLGEHPYVIDGAGQKLSVGSVVTDGWAIDGIEADRVFVRRQGQRVAVRF